VTPLETARHRASPRWVVGLLLAVLAWGTVAGADLADVVPSAERSAHLAAMKARVEEPSSLTPMTVAEVVALPRPPRAYTRAQLTEISDLEGRGVSVIGYVARVARKRDGDFHVQITMAPPPEGCLRRNTRDQLITELTPQFQARRPAYTLPTLQALCGTPTQVRISGWLFYDAPHDRDRQRSTGWEVHPLTRIEVCCWRELP
jgi:hypothetical protein